MMEEERRLKKFCEAFRNELAAPDAAGSNTDLPGALFSEDDETPSAREMAKTLGGMSL